MHWLCGPRQIVLALLILMLSAEAVHAQCSPDCGAALESVQETGFSPLPRDPRSIPLPSPARSGRARVHLSSEFGFGGRFEQYTVTRDLGVSVGASLRVRFSLGKYLYIGPALQVTAYDASGDRSVVLDLGAGVGVRYGIEVGSFAIEPSLGVTFGAAFGINPSPGAVFDPYEAMPVGVSFGVRAGTSVWLTDALGVHLNLGWHLHRMNSYHFDQFRLGLGLVFRNSD